MVGEKLLAQETSGHSTESCNYGEGFRFNKEPIRSDGVKSTGLIGRLSMQANGGDVLVILLSNKKVQRQSW